MAVSTPVTYTGSVLSVAAVAIKDDTTEANFSFSRESIVRKTWGGVVASVGQIEGDGNITLLYSETSGGPLETLRDEFFGTPTSGGLATIFEPLGTSTGNERLSFNIGVSGASIGGEPDDDILGEFDVVVSSTPTWTTQS